MSVEIQKQLDLRPYSDKNVVTKPAVQKQTAAPSVDEEKSNAAKWMIGLTASAAIAIGGLYAAKHGKLGKTAEKWAKKLFGETVKEAKSSTTNATSSSAAPIVDTPALALAPLVFARKGISRLIKKPNKTLTEIMTEFEQAGVKLEKKGENLLEIRTGKRPNDITQLNFTPEGILSSIQRTTKKSVQETFTFENNVLSRLEREIPTTHSRNPLMHLVEFAQDGSVKAKRFILNHGPEFEPINSNAVKMFKTEDIVEAFIPRTSEYFKQAVQELEIARKPAEKFGQKSSINVGNILSPFRDANHSAKEAKFLEKSLYTPEMVTRSIEKLLGSKNEFAAEVLKLVRKDIDGMTSISYNTLKSMALDYTKKLRAYKITKPEHIAIVGKPLKDCSYKELETIINEVAPGRINGVLSEPFKDKAEEQKLIIKTMEQLTGRKKIDENCSLLEILRDL